MLICFNEVYINLKIKFLMNLQSFFSLNINFYFYVLHINIKNTYKIVIIKN